MVWDPALLTKQVIEPPPCLVQFVLGPPTLFLRRPFPRLASVTQPFPRHHLESSRNQLRGREALETLMTTLGTQMGRRQTRLLKREDCVSVGWGTQTFRPISKMDMLL